MKMLRRLMARLGGLRGDAGREREMADELEAHVALAAEDRVRAGMTPAAARRAAILELGGVEKTKQAYREGSTLPWLENGLRDLRFAVRQLRKNLGFTVTAVLMLALGTGASVAIFAFVDAALVKPLPYVHPESLISVFESIELGPHFNLSYPDYLDWKRQNSVLTSLEAYRTNGFALKTAGGTEVVRGAISSDGFFRTLGVTPVLGRDFQPGEDLPSAARTVMVTYGTWQKRYGGRADVLGQTVVLDEHPNTIIGVLPKDFHFAPTGSPEFWATLHADGSCDLRRSCHSMFGLGRLKPGVTVAAASANLVAVAAGLEKMYPNDNKGQSASVLPLAEHIVGDIRPILLLLLGGAGLLLLIACVNVASLLLVRSEGRRREIAVRSALGASPGRITRQFLTEALVLVTVGTGLGLGMAAGAMRLLLALIPRGMLARMPYLNGLGLNVRVVGFALAIAVVATIVFSLTPALRLSLTKVQEGLADGGRGAAGTVWRRFGANLVVVELATAMVLLVGAGLLGKSFYKLLHVELGFQPEHLASVSIGAPIAKYGKDEPAAALAQRLVERAQAVPGVQAATVSSGIPIGGSGTEWIRVLGRPWHGEHLEMPYLEVSDSYLKTIGGVMGRGRFFTADDTLGKPRVAVINRAFEKAYFPGEDPIGQRLAHTSVATEPPMEIVGIAEDVREGSLDQPISPVLYFPFAQSTETYLSLIVRTAQAPGAVLPALTEAVRGVDPDLTPGDPETMTVRISDSSSAYMHRSTAFLVGGFAVTALLLGVVGLYGVVAYSVSQRTREIGVRMALGAQRGTVYRLVLREAGSLAVWGIGVGLICSVGAASWMRGMLFEVRAWDVSTLVAVAGLLGACAVVASYLPARRAASINPVEALRAE